MSNLRNTENGRNACLAAQRHLLEKRLSRFFERNLVIDYDRWSAGTQEFDIGTMLAAQGELNSAHDAEILELYSLLGTVGGLPETIADINVYVNANTGSDATGTGSAARPYASLWFIETLPRRIEHNVRVILQSDVVTTYPLHFDFEIGNGTFALMGQGPATVIETGLTVNATTPTNGTAGLVVNTTAVWSADRELTFLRAIDGVEANRVSPVHQSDHTASQLVINRIPLNGLANPDEIEFIAPSLELTCPSITFTCRSPRAYDLEDSRGARVALVNINVNIQGVVNDTNECLYIENSGAMLMSFVRFVGDITSGRINSDINTVNFVDTDLETYANCGILNLNNDTTPLSFVPDCGGFIWNDAIGGNQPLICGSSSRVWSFCCRVLVGLLDTTQIRYCSVGYISGKNGVFYIGTVMAYGRISAGLGAGFEFTCCRVEMDSVDVITADNVVTILSATDISVKSANRNPGLGTVSGYGIYFFGIGRCQLNDAGTNFDGATNDIYFATVAGGAAAAHPAAYLEANDTQGTQVKRLA